MRAIPTSLRRAWIGVLLVLAGCLYQGSDHPVVRKFSWFSYLNGDDLRAACRPGAPDAFRLVYNAVYVHQVRTYDVTPGADRGRYRLRVGVSEEADLSNFTTELANPDIFQPWRARETVSDLRESDVGLLRKALRDSGARNPAPDGLQLPSHKFYWIVAACTDGKFHFNAYLWPSPRFAAARFDKVLFAWDKSEIPVIQPRPTTLWDIYGTNDERKYVNYFTLEIGKKGLSGL